MADDKQNQGEVVTTKTDRVLAESEAAEALAAASGIIDGFKVDRAAAPKSESPGDFSKLMQQMFPEDVFSGLQAELLLRAEIAEDENARAAARMLMQVEAEVFGYSKERVDKILYEREYGAMEESSRLSEEEIRGVKEGAVDIKQILNLESRAIGLMNQNIFAEEEVARATRAFGMLAVAEAQASGFVDGTEESEKLIADRLKQARTPVIPKEDEPAVVNTQDKTVTAPEATQAQPENTEPKAQTRTALSFKDAKAVARGQEVAEPDHQSQAVSGASARREKIRERLHTAPEKGELTVEQAAAISNRRMRPAAAAKGETMRFGWDMLELGAALVNAVPNICMHLVHGTAHGIHAVTSTIMESMDKRAEKNAANLQRREHRAGVFEEAGSAPTATWNKMMASVSRVFTNIELDVANFMEKVSTAMASTGSSMDDARENLRAATLDKIEARREVSAALYENKDMRKHREVMGRVHALEDQGLSSGEAKLQVGEELVKEKADARARAVEEREKARIAAIKKQVEEKKAEEAKAAAAAAKKAEEVKASQDGKKPEALKPLAPKASEELRAALEDLTAAARLSPSGEERQRLKQSVADVASSVAHLDGMDKETANRFIGAMVAQANTPTADLDQVAKAEEYKKSAQKHLGKAEQIIADAPFDEKDEERRNRMNYALNMAIRAEAGLNGVDIGDKSASRKFFDERKQKLFSEEKEAEHKTADGPKTDGKSEVKGPAGSVDLTKKDGAQQKVRMQAEAKMAAENGGSMLANPQGLKKNEKVTTDKQMAPVPEADVKREQVADYAPAAPQNPAPQAAVQHTAAADPVIMELLNMIKAQNEEMRQLRAEITAIRAAAPAPQQTVDVAAVIGAAGAMVKDLAKVLGRAGVSNGHKPATAAAGVEVERAASGIVLVSDSYANPREQAARDNVVNFAAREGGRSGGSQYSR